MAMFPAVRAGGSRPDVVQSEAAKQKQREEEEAAAETADLQRDWTPERKVAEQLIAALVEEWKAPM